jgi:hypothetical protein
MTATTSPRPSTAVASGEQAQTGARLVDLVWLTWRQHRWAIVASLALGAGLTGWMAYLAARITTINQQCGNTGCAGDTPQYAALHGTYGLLPVAEYLTLVVILLPLLIGVFLGIPLLAREHEQRTLLLAWSQDITPQRWLWTKLTLLGALTAVLTAAVSAASDHLAHVLAVTGQNLFGGTAFHTTGMLPLVLSVVWFIVGVALGAAMRRTMPAVFAALAGYVGLYFIVQWRYPTFQTPLTATVPLGAPKDGARPIDPNALMFNQGPDQIVDAGGHSVDPQALCPPPDGSRTSDAQCLAEHHLSLILRYQPGSRIPDFHLILALGYLGIGGLAVAAIWWLVRRTSLSAG